ncbi:MAG: TMEM165/GDT1 family protein [Symploca sp. SIO2E9]|nr:TMEM165/GDT1 family protein [Symploca sp. SIO2E9]
MYTHPEHTFNLEPALTNKTQDTDSTTITESVTNEPITDPQNSQSLQETQRGRWGIFYSTFVTIFLAEIGDKTQLATLLISAQSHSPWIVFAGAAVALIVTSLLGVLIGHWLSKRVSPKTMETAAGVLLLFIALTLLLDVVHLGG